MTRLALAVTDFALPVETAAAPRLPRLERLLARGSVTAAATPGWRHWVLERVGARPPDPLPVAGTVAGRPGHWAIATPLGLLAGLEHVHLDPRGPPALDAAEWQALVAGFNALFGADGLCLSCEDGVGLLSLPRLVEAATWDPLPLAGRDAGPWLPAGPDGGWLRRLTTEVQMWLHEWPYNAARSARGARPVNSLWFWGLGDAELTLTTGRLPLLASGDPFLRRLWQRAGCDSAPEPRRLEDLPEPPAGTAIATLSLAALDADAALALEALEQHWLAPIDVALADGRLGRVEIYLGGPAASLGPSDRFRFWRRRRSWHEALR
jgi:hypothetical protein